MFLKKAKKSPPKYYVWVLLGIIVFGLALWLWQWWNARLPEDPKKATVEVADKMERITAVDLRINHTLMARNNPNIEVRSEVKMKLPDEYEGKMKIDGPESFLKELPFTPELEFARIGGKNYTKESGKAEWVDHSGDPDFVPFLKVDPIAFLKFSLDSADIAREKDDTIDGTEYAVYSFVFPQTKLAEAVKPFSLLIDAIPDEAEVKGQIWFDPRTRLLYQQKISVILPDTGGEEVTTIFSNYNGLVLFSARDMVVSATPAGTSDQSAAAERQNREERNQKRQVDLMALKAALEKIYEDEHVYPEAPESINLGDDQSAVRQKLLKYLKEVPADPLAPKYYYAYKCTGGEQYELTGIQESDTGSPKVIMLTQGYDYFKDK